MPVRTTTRRQFIGGGLAAALLVSCGGGDRSGDTAARGSGTSSDSSVASGSRTVTHDVGTVEVPAEPQRVVAMENRRDLETAVVLGLPLVGVGVWGGGPDVAAPFVPFDSTGVEVINTAEPNFEQIAALRPDLIVSREYYLQDDFLEGRVVDAAPVLPVASQGPWRPDLEQIAGWLGRDATLTAALDQYDALVDEVRDRHADLLGSARVAIVGYYPADQMFYGGSVDGFQLQANTLGELGGSLIPFLADRNYHEEPFSLENIGELEAADAILLVTSNEEVRATLAEVELWRRLPAVSAGRVVHTDTRTNQGSVYAATECVRLLDELYRTLA